MHELNTNLSYFRIRKIIGILGISLPFSMLIGYGEILTSISDYYYTYMNILFTSTLMVTGVFLISYRGNGVEKNTISDNILTNLGGFFIIITALVPTKYVLEGSCQATICNYSQGWEFVHLSSAALFFILMGWMSVKRFTKGNTKLYGKKKRNKIYKATGYGIWAVMGILIILFLMEKLKAWQYTVYTAETIMLVLFGISWLVKGKALADLGILKEE